MSGRNWDRARRESSDYKNAAADRESRLGAVRSFASKYPGQCKACKQYFPIGTYVTKSYPKGVYHASCPDTTTVTKTTI